MALAHGFPFSGVRLRKLRGAFDVGEEQDDGTKWEISQWICSARVLKPAMTVPQLAVNYILSG